MVIKVIYLWKTEYKTVYFMEQIEPSYNAGGNAKYNYFGKQSSGFNYPVVQSLYHRHLPIPKMKSYDDIKNRAWLFITIFQKPKPETNLHIFE